ncbi:MAG: AsmA family protein [Acidobacteria bacterium]|nr:AsmA family protein [Acidobacteriota bacterium]
MGKILKIGAGALGVILVAVAALLLFVDVNQFRPQIQGQLEQTLGRKVSLGELKLKLLPLAIRVTDLAIGDDPGFSSGHFVKAREIDVQVGLLPLLKKEVRVDTLLLREPTVELIRKNGVWNFSTLGAQSTPQSASQSGGAGGELELRELRLIDGVVAVTDKARAVYEDIDMTVKDLSVGKPFTAEVTMKFPQDIRLVASLAAKYDKPSRTIDISSLGVKLGTFQATGAGKIVTATTPAQLDLDVNVPGAAIAELTRLAAAADAGFKPDMKVDGTVQAKMHVSGAADKPQLTGNIEATKVEVNRQGWKQPVRTPAIHVQLTPASIVTSPFEVESGGTRLKVAATVSDYATGKPMVNASASTQGRIEELLNVAAAYGVGSVHDVQGTGDLALDVKIFGPSSDLSFSGNGSIDDASIHLATLKKPIAVKSAKIRFEEDRAVLENLVASLAGSTLRGTMKVRNFASPELEFQADVDQLDVAALQGITVTAPAAAPAPDTKKKKRTVAAAPQTKPLERMKGKGVLSVGKVQHGTVTLTKVRSDVTLDKGVLRMDPLTAELFGGAQKGHIQVDLRPEIPAFSLSTRFEKVDANQLLSSTSSVKNFVYGVLMADGDVRMAPKSGEDFAKSLNGSVGFKLNNGKLAGVSIINELSKVAKFLGYSEQAQLVTNILSLSGTMKFDNGVGSTNDLKLAFDGGTLGAAGTIGLVDQQLKLKVTSILSREASERFGGNRIGGFMTTALANKNGEIVIPCLVSGSTAKPVFTPDAGEFARLKVQNIIPTTGNVLDVIKGGQQEGIKGVGGALLDMFGGKKKAPAKKE